MIPEDGYNYGNLVIIMLFFAGFTLFGVLLMVLDFKSYKNVVDN